MMIISYYFVIVLVVAAHGVLRTITNKTICKVISFCFVGLFVLEAQLLLCRTNSSMLCAQELLLIDLGD